MVRTNVITDNVTESEVVDIDVLDNVVLDDSVKSEDKNRKSDKAPDKPVNAFYDRNGNYLGTDNVKEDKAYITTSFNVDYLKNEKGMVDWTAVKKAPATVLLSIPHANFQYCAGVIAQEGTDNSLDEMIAIAHVTRNNVTQDDQMAAKLATGFSRVLDSDKKPLQVSSVSSRAKNARAGVIHALTEDDTTDGAILWDGVDFLAWGIDRPAKAGGGAFPKLVQGVEISKPIYDAFLAAILLEYPSGKVSYQKRYGVTCDVPNRVFEDSANWFEGGTVFRYKTGGGAPALSATLTAGRSIFWKSI